MPKFEKLAESKKAIAVLLGLLLSGAVAYHERDMTNLHETLGHIHENVKEIKEDQKEQMNRYEVDLRYETDKIYAETDGLEIRVRQLEINEGK